MAQVQVVKKITFSSNQTALAEYRATSLGLSFSEYVKHLISKDTETISNQMETLNEKGIEELKQSIESFKRGDYETVTNLKELRAKLSQWKKEALQDIN